MRHHRPNLVRFARRMAVCGVVAFLVLPFTSGCKTNKRYDLIEAELRTREKELADTRAALDQSRNLLRAYEASQQRGAPIPQGGGPFLPLKEIVIGRGTGGVDEDGAPGDEGLMVVIVPRDEDGSAVKVPARALVAAWEITPAGLKNPIGSWELNSEQLRRTWKSGLISTGYFVAVPWQTLPSTDRVRVAVRLITTDNRAYESDRDVYVKPPYPPRNNVLPYPQTTPIPVRPGTPTPTTPSPGGRVPLFPEMPPPGVPSAIPPGTEELPPPAPLDRGAKLLAPVKQ
jgi:hypothetical protein